MMTVYYNEMFDFDDGTESCTHCGKQPKIRICTACGSVGRIIDCGHKVQPRPIAAGRVDGSHAWLDYCEDCSKTEINND